LAPWRKPLAVGDPAKILLDVAVGLALGGDCLADPSNLVGSTLLMINATRICKALKAAG